LQFVEPIRDLVADWSHKLLVLQQTLEEWMTCQKHWLYLEAIFASQDIIRQLPEESVLFSQVDKGWKDLMRRTNDNPNAISAGTYNGLRETLLNYNAVLERIHKQLEAYLETKRQAFPRFYFLSNDELLKILANSKSTEAVQSFLPKCFDNIQRLEFADRDIKAMRSAEGERVPLSVNLKARGAVETWLSAVEADMTKTLRKFMKRGVVDYERLPRRDWMLEKFGQVVLAVAQIAWCRACEQAILANNPKQALSRWHEAQLNQLSELTELVRSDLHPTDRRKVVALITGDVHNRDVTAELISENVSSLQNFLWQRVRS